METPLSLTCLICTKKSPSSNRSIRIKQGGSDCPMLDAELHVFFALRQLMEIPVDQCSRVITSHGSPSEWGWFCRQCSKLVHDAQEIAQQIKDALRKLEYFKEQVQNMVIHQEELSANNSQHHATVQKIRKKFRNIIIHSNENDSMFMEQNCEDSNSRALFKSNREDRNNEVGNWTKSDFIKSSPKSVYDNDDGSFDKEWELGEEDGVLENDQESENSSEFQLELPKIQSKKSRSKKNSSPSSRKKKTKFQCSFEGCQKWFGLELLRDAHFKHIHEGIAKPFVCDQESCGKAFKLHVSLQVHRQIHHTPVSENNSFICELCGKVYYNRIAFRRHVSSHSRSSSDVKYPCNECGKLFRTAANFERHRLVHTDAPKCDICSTTFHSKVELFNHRRLEHQAYEGLPRVATLVCDQCGKTFATNTNLRRHTELVHEQIFKFTCTICNMGQADKSSHDRHMLSHSKFKPYTCDICGKGLTRGSDLSRHKRLHTGEKPYKCDKCNESFTDASKVKKHMKTHHGEATYVCENCGKKFYMYTQLRLHVKIHDPAYQLSKTLKKNQRLESLSTSKTETTQVTKKKGGRPRKPRLPKPIGKRGRPRKIKQHDYNDSSSNQTVYGQSNVPSSSHALQYQLSSSSIYAGAQTIASHTYHQSNNTGPSFHNHNPERFPKLSNF